MTEETKSKTPQIRFKGFEGKWEEKTLGEITTKIGSGKTPKGGDKSYVNSGVPLIRSQNIANDTVYLEKAAFITQETDEEMANSRVKTNDVLLNITGASIGRSAVYRHEGPANVNQHVCIIRPLPKFSPDFIQLHLSSPNGQLKIDSNQAGGAREGLNFQQISWMGFDYPKFPEQTRIGGYFRELDRLIGLQQGKHDKLVTLKKAMLHAMFPQPGATTPAIRFQGFSGPWVEKKLGEIGEIVTGSTPSTQNRAFYTNRGIPWVTPTDIENNVTFTSARHLSKDGEKIARIVPKDTILVTCIASIGKNTILGTRGGFNQQINGLIPRHAYNAYFLFTQSSLWSEKMKSTAASGTMQIVNKSEFSELKTICPEFKEQQKIGHYFRTLDELITRHALHLQKLKQLKSACLEKMFV